jgi:hypothetical protein
VRQAFVADERVTSLRAWLADEFRKPASSRNATAQAIFDELEVAEGGARRHLLESERFRALLAEAALPRAA